MTVPYYTSALPTCARFGVVATAVVLLAGAAPPRDAGASACPSSIVYLNSYHGSSPFPVDVPVYDTTFVDFNTAHVTFDRTQGSMSFTASSDGRLRASVRVVERFDVAGVPPGTHLNATMEFRLDGWSENPCGGAGCGVECAGTLVAGGDSVAADANQQGPGTGQRVNLSTTLTLPVEFAAGSPIEVQFFLTYGTGPGGSARGEIAAHYAVSGLPAGVHAIACAGADVTPVWRTTWGSLKSRYR